MPLKEILTSLHGRRLGLSKSNSLVLENGVGQLEEALQAPYDRVTLASTSENIGSAGLTRVSTAATAYTMDAPRTGDEKKLVSVGASTVARTVTLESGTFQSTSGSSQNRATFSLQGQSLSLQAVSTALYHVIGNVGSVALATA